MGWEEIKMLAEIEKVIKEQLPSRVGEELQQVLTKAKEDADRVEHLTKKNKDLETQLQKYRHIWETLEEAKKQLEVAEVKRKDVEFKEILLQQREELMKERLKDLKEITQTVFRSNRLDYTLSLAGSSSGHNAVTGQYETTSVGASGTISKGD